MTITLPSFTLTDIAAWIGALSGIGALLWQFATWRRSAHRVTVTRSHAWVALPDGSVSPPLVAVTARNIGSTAVTVTGWGVALMPTKENLTVIQPLPTSTPLPHRLEAGASMDVHVRASDLERAWVERGVPYRKQRAWVRLATGQTVWAKRGMPQIVP